MEPFHLRRQSLGVKSNWKGRPMTHLTMALVCFPLDEIGRVQDSMARCRLHSLKRLASLHLDQLVGR